ncbi:Nucleolar protein 13 [Knufia obscura]|uniref:Nucleolar protein 13 n=1 Tax=Knufia obscura TaxID=1635080 RepID=A0ABR0RQJ0_9EURO|nr:Nucleolar protein 13 [Knufia obscura]
MSVTTAVPVSAESKKSKRKRDEDLAELEVDINADEPPSKKALRKAKRSKTAQTDPSKDEAHKAKSAITSASKGKEEIDPMTNQSRSGFGIWIGNLSFFTTRDDLMSFVTGDADHPITKAEVTRIHMPSGPMKNGKPQNKGFAYIDFADQTALNHGLELSEKLLAGRRVLIKDAKSFEGRPASKEDIASGKTPSRKVFVGNLSFDTTTEMLEEHFGVCGAIQKTQIATFEDSGKCKGYAWVEFEELSSAQAAMRGWIEQGTSTNAKQSKRRVWLKQMNGRQLRMEFAEDSVTRYNKRFGKEAKKTNGTGPDDAAENQAPITEVNDQVGSAPPPRTKRDSDNKHRRRNGYEDETVKKLTGAITEGTGKKVVFD